MFALCLAVLALGGLKLTEAPLGPSVADARAEPVAAAGQSPSVGLDLGDAVATGDYATGAPGDPDAETYVGWAAARPIEPAAAPAVARLSGAAIDEAVDRDAASPAPLEDGVLADGDIGDGVIGDGAETAALTATALEAPAPINGIGATISRLLGAEDGGAAPLARALERRSAAAARDGATLELISIATGARVRVIAAGRLDADEAVDIAVPPEVAEALGAAVDAPFLVLVTPAVDP